MFDPRYASPLTGGGFLGGSPYDPSDLQNFCQAGSANYHQMLHQLQNWVSGFTAAHNFQQPKAVMLPEEYGPFRPPMPTWRYETEYAPGRSEAWMPPLRDPGAILLKACAILAVYPVVYVLIELVRGLINAL